MIVIFTNNDSAYQTAIDFHNQNIKVAAIVDVRKNLEGDLPTKVKKEKFLLRVVSYLEVVD